MSSSPSARRRYPRPLPARRRALAVLLTLLTALVGPASLALAAPAAGQPQEATTAAATAVKKTGYQDNVFVIYRNEQGETSCREATAAEKTAINNARRGDGSGDAGVIYTGGGGRSFVNAEGEEERSPGVTETGVSLQPSVGLRIVLHATARLQEPQNAAVRDAFIVAANRWEALISTPITVVLDVDYGPNFFGGQPFGQDVLGATGTSSLSASLPTVRTRLINNAPEADELQLYNALPTTTVPVELNGSNTTATSVLMTWPVARALGLRADITNPDAVPLMQGDAGIAFNSNFDFDFDPNNGISSGFLDFDAVVVHEIGHALGFTSESGDGLANPVGILDLFRFRPSAANINTVGTAPRVMSEGGTQVFFSNRVNTFGTTELQLSTGGSDGEGGDNEQSSHWKDNRFTSFIGIMDPTLGSGRQVLTSNDLAAFDVLGYKIGGTAPPPPPPPANDNFASAVVLNGATGTVTGTNIAATRETGEPNPANDSGTPSVWYRWTAPGSGLATFDTIGSDYDTTLGGYTGSIVTALTLAGPNAQDDDIDDGVLRTSRISFNAVAGTTYNIQVNGWRGETGSIVLNWTAPGSQPTTFRISGRVTDNLGNGIGGAGVALSGPQTGNTTTDASGNYAFNGLPAGNYFLFPGKAGFVGSVQPVNNLNADRTVNLVLNPDSITVSGTIRDAQNNVIPGVGYNVTGASGTNTQTANDSGFYSAIITPSANSPVTITPVKYGYTFSPASATFNGTSGGSQTVNFTGTLNNPIDASAAFVTQHYRDFLGREPDQAGLDFWRSGIDQCGPNVSCTEVKRIDTSAAFFLSIESQETGVLVYRMWKAAYANIDGTPVPVRRQQFLEDTALVGQNVQVGVGPWQQTLEANKAAYANTFANRAVFTGKYGTMTNAQYVDALNVNAEGALSQAERDALVSGLDLGTETRATVLRKVAEDETLRQSQLRKAFVLMQYFGYLRRDPDAADFQGNLDPQFLGYQFWLGKLNQFNGSYIDAEMVKAFITSIEYRQRFGQ